METIRIFPNVRLGEGIIIQEGAVIGIPPLGVAPGAWETVIEAGATIRSNAVIYAGSRIGPGFQTGHRTILGPGLEIGANCSIGTNSVVRGFVRLFDKAKIHGFSNIGAFSILQEGAWVGPRCILEGDEKAPVIIAAGAMLGSTVYVSRGVRVGERALVAASVLLTQDVPPYHLIAGNPPKSLKDIARLTCPYELIERPYEPDSPSVREAISIRHQVRSPDEFPTNTWRHHLWQSLGSSEVFL